MRLFEILAFVAIILFGVIQIGMMIASHYFNPKVKAWKESLLTSRSTMAKLELIIFF